MPKPNKLYDQMVEITTDYLGPAADRFIDRQIQSHLGKNPSAVTKKDIPELVSWSKIAMALLTNDTAIVDEFTSRFMALASDIKGQK